MQVGLGVRQLQIYVGIRKYDVRRPLGRSLGAVLVIFSTMTQKCEGKLR
jgi:hypothetical protein